MKSAPGELASRVLLDGICGVRVPVNDPSGRGPLCGRVEQESERSGDIGFGDRIADQPIQFQNVGKPPKGHSQRYCRQRQFSTRGIEYFSQSR